MPEPIGFECPHCHVRRPNQNAVHPDDGFISICMQVVQKACSDCEALQSDCQRGHADAQAPTEISWSDALRVIEDVLNQSSRLSRADAYGLVIEIARRLGVLI
jgi:hypothetical protein